MANDRRDFFKAVGAVAAGAMISAPRTAEAAGAGDRFAPAFRPAFSLDGDPPEPVLRADGGEIRGVVVSQVGFNNQIDKRLSTIAYEEIALALGANQSTTVYSWIQSMLNGTPLAKNGSILAIDARGTARNQIRFSNGRITEVAFPALDARSRLPASISLTIEPEGLLPRERVTTQPVASRGTKQKAWSTSNFRLSVDGFTAAENARITRIEAITVRQSFDYPPPASSGSVTAGPLEVSDLVFYCPEEFAEPFRAWARDFIVQGNRTERFATLEFLATDQRTVLFTLGLSGLGIFACSLEGDDQRTAAGRVVKVEVYCESANFTVGRQIPA